MNYGLMLLTGKNTSPAKWKKLRTVVATRIRGIMLVLRITEVDDEIVLFCVYRNLVRFACVFSRV